MYRDYSCYACVADCLSELKERELLNATCYLGGLSLARILMRRDGTGSPVVSSHWDCLAELERLLMMLLLVMCDDDCADVGGTTLGEFGRDLTLIRGDEEETR